MNTVLPPSFVERFREAGTPCLSPKKVGDIFGFSLLELAERACVHPSIPTARPDVSQLQNYLRDMIRLLAVATELSGDDRRAAFLLRNEPLPAFDYKTAVVLVQDGRADAVIAYLESLASGAAG